MICSVFKPPRRAGMPFLPLYSGSELITGGGVGVLVGVGLSCGRAGFPRSATATALRRGGGVVEEDAHGAAANAGR